MGGRASRNKGAAGEREVFKLLNEALGVEYFRRNLDQSRHGGADDDPTLHSFPMVVEVKRQEKDALTTWMRQVQAAAEPLDKIPVVAHRKSNAPWRFYVCMDSLQFVHYLRSLLYERSTSAFDINGLLKGWRT